MQAYQKVVFPQNSPFRTLPKNPKDYIYPSIYNPNSSSKINEIHISQSPTVNLPNNSIKFISLKDFEQKNLLDTSNYSKKPNNFESLANQSLFSQINENIAGYKSEKMGQMETEISGLLKLIKEKQGEVAVLKGDVKALAIALKEKDIIQRDSQFLENSLNNVLIENRRLNELTKEKIKENDFLKEKMERIIKENEVLMRKKQELEGENQEIKEENQELKGEKEENRRNSELSLRNFSKEIDVLRKNNNEIQRNSQIKATQIPIEINENPVFQQEIEQNREKIQCLMAENIRLNELNIEKTYLNENLVQLIEKSEELIRENERLNILIKEQTIENNSWRNKLHEADQKLLVFHAETQEKNKGFASETEELKQRNQRLLEEVQQLVFLIQEKEKIIEENKDLRRDLDKKEETIQELKGSNDKKENSGVEIKELQRKMEGIVLENIKLNNFIEEKLKDYNALEDLNRKIEVLIAENMKLNNMMFEGQNQIEYWKTRYFEMNPLK